MDYLGANCDMIWMNIYYKIYLQKFFFFPPSLSRKLQNGAQPHFEILF